MSHENVEIVRAFVEAAGRDPKEGSSYFADDLEFIRRHLDGPARGPAGFMSRVEELSSQFETYNVRAERLEQVGELVVADLRREATTKRGPAVIEDRSSQIFTLHDGEIVRVESFSTFDEALEAAGLRE